MEETAAAPSRPICSDGCGRPKRVCICEHLPDIPIHNSTTVVVLQHPHELRRRLATAPLLPRCLLNCFLLSGRRLHSGSHPLLDSLHENPEDPPAALFLFPGEGQEKEEEEISRYRGACRVLIVFDGTWTHAAEMVKASMPFIGAFARRVSLAGGRDRAAEGASMFESDLALRKEPHRGCMSSAEAVARALGALEPLGWRGEAAILAAVRAVVSAQMEHLVGKTVTPRSRQEKKKKKKEDGVQLLSAAPIRRND